MKKFLILCQILFLAMGFLGGNTVMGGILEGPIQNPANSRTYYLLEPDITWTQAEAEAISLGGHLVTINDAAEQAWVWSTFGEGKDRWLWIGINDVAVEGSFVWASGEPVNYTNWTPGEPNDGGAGEDYGEMDFFWGGKWNDLPNDGWKFRHYGVVERGILEGPIQNPANSHTYYLLEPDITWTQAEAEAISLGGHLVTINDAAEQAWVWSTFGEGKDRWLWIGINDVAVEGSFVWASGEPVNYTNWTPGEPNDGGAGEDYGEMDFFWGGKWNDLPNDGWKFRHYGVVEKCSFVDIPPEYWAEDAICRIYDEGITKGCSQNPLKYCPKVDVTREQMAAFIVRAVEGEPPANYCGTGSPFSDVPSTSVFCKYIKRLSELGITEGCGGGKYCPKTTVTREQMAAFLVRAVEGEPPPNYCVTGSPFSDVPSTSVFCKYIKRLSELGITKGCGGDNYCPKTTVKRDQMAVFLGRAFLGMD